MPLYEYRCASCGHQQEFLQKWSDAQMTVCTACGKDTFSKMLTAAGFQLKGSGWYATDFKGSGSAKPAAKTEAKGDVKSDAKSDAKGDAKSESKSTGDGAKKDAAPPASGSSGPATSA